MKWLAFVVGVVTVVVVAVVGFVVLFVGALAANAAEVPIPPELEAAYRQVGARTGVHWAALAAWDAAGDFELPIPSVDELYADRIAARLRSKREAAEEWCREHPADTLRCPPESPELTPQEEAALWRGAHEAWRQLLHRHIEQSVVVLASPDFERGPEGVYARSLAPGAAARAAELFEGYQLLDSLDADADEILIEPFEPPADWVPVDGFAWPVVAPITSRYGMRVSPIDGVRRLHAGVDLGVSTGTPIRASKAGTVVVAEMNPTYGLMVVVDHGEGYQSLYAHSSALAVQPGQHVEQGQVVSYAGSTGLSTGPHLHFEIHYNETPVDPLLLLSQRSGRE
ncbi:MAG TPA: M23 family metallopeptidase [Symbiobacteriaceae bacterium]|nr:M23 family metallopeptidase [Symbiobacteriaceae bacterium]